MLIQSIILKKTSSSEVIRMWPQGSTILKTFSENLHQFLLLNTIKQSEGGLSFSDLKAMNAGNHSFLYRELRKLVEENFLEQKAGNPDQHEREGGRPKQLFTLTGKGTQRLETLQESLRAILDGIMHLLPQGQEIDVSDFLEKGTFAGLVNPIDLLLRNKNRTVEEKLQVLGEIETTIEAQLARVRSAKKQLEEYGDVDAPAKPESRSLDQVEYQNTNGGNEE